MIRASLARLVTTALVAGGLSLSATSLAGEPDELTRRKNAARAMADLAFDQYSAGRYAEAIDSFRKADDLYHAPTLVYGLAKSLLNAGKLIEARVQLKRLIDEPLDAKAPAEFLGAQETAKDLLAALEGRIPSLRISVTGAAGRRFTVRLDDAPLESFASIELNPGGHTITVVPETGVGVSRSVQVNDGAHEQIEIALPPPAPSRPAGPPGLREPSAPRNALMPAAWVAFGVGAAGLGVGAATGIVSLSQVSDIKSRCANDLCPASERENADRARVMATVSTASFVAGGVSLAVGAALVFIGRKQKPANVGLSIGPGTVGVSGVFQ